MKLANIALLTTVLAVSPLALASSSSSSSSEANGTTTNKEAVPEMDAGTAGIALGLVVVVTALIRERRKRL